MSKDKTDVEATVTKKEPPGDISGSWKIPKVTELTHNFNYN